MNVKPFLRYSYRIIEILLILSITIGIVFCIGLDSHDRAEMQDVMALCIIGLLWVWFISLPLTIIVIASIIRCIPPASTYKKVVLMLHILNAAILFAFYITLPKAEPCNATIMAEHYEEHHKEMYDLVRYVHRSLGDSCSILLEYRNDEITDFMIENGHEYRSNITDQEGIENAVRLAGLSKQETATIQAMMRKAGIIGIEIDNRRDFDGSAKKNILLFRWHGSSKYQYALYDRPMTKQERDEASSLYQFLLYNDSVVFESYGSYISQKGFTDRYRFQKRDR